MRVLHLISSGGMYGAEAVILNLSAALNARGDHSAIGLFSNSAQPNLQLHEAASRVGIESHLIPCRGQVDRTVGSKIRQLSHALHVDVVHAHGYKADVYAWMALRGSTTPLISTCHTWYDNNLAVRLYGALDRFLLKQFDAVVAVSDEVRDRLLRAGVAPAKVSIIRNGIDLRPFLHAEQARRQRQTQTTGASLRIGLVGRLAPEKGVDLFLRAAAETAQAFPDASFVIAGDGPDRGSLERLIEELGLQGRASLLGRTDDMIGFYGSLDVLVSASRQEGLPIALLEGMASALPVVATAVGAVPQVVRDGQTGILLPPGDPSRLSVAVQQMLRDDHLRSNLGKAAQHLIADEFSAARMTAEYIELYQKVSSACTEGSTLRPTSQEDSA